MIRHFTYFHLTDDVITMKFDTMNGQKLFYYIIWSISLSMKYHVKNDMLRFVSDKVASYGPVTGIFLGSYPTIIINDWKLARSLFLKEEFSGRIRW